MKTCADISFLMQAINSDAKHQNASLAETLKKMSLLKRDAKTRYNIWFLSLQSEVNCTVQTTAVCLLCSQQYQNLLLKSPAQERNQESAA